MIPSVENGAAASTTELVRHGRIVFNIVVINIAIMMATDSIFSAISPYLWLGDVFAESGTLVKLYAASTSLFYIANTFFVCLLLYLVYYFGLEPKVEDGQAAEKSHRTVSEWESRQTYQNPFLAMEDISSGSMVLMRSGSDDEMQFEFYKTCSHNPQPPTSSLIV